MVILISFSPAVIDLVPLHTYPPAWLHTSAPSLQIILGTFLIRCPDLWACLKVRRNKGNVSPGLGLLTIHPCIALLSRNFCAVAAVAAIFCVVHRNYCLSFFPFFFFVVVVAICTWGSTYYRLSPLVQPFLSLRWNSIQPRVPPRVEPSCLKEENYLAPK